MKHLSKTKQKANKRKLIQWVAAMFGGIALLSVFVVAGCEDKPSGGYDASAVEAVVDEIIEDVAEDFVDAAFASAPVEVPDDELSFYNDMLVADSVVYAVFDKGLVAYDLTNDSYKTVASDEPLNAIIMHDGELYVGGKALYRVVDFKLKKRTVGDGAFRIINPAFVDMELQFESGISDLASFGSQLMIGTNDGLFSLGDGPSKLIKEGIEVTAMTADDNGFWVGTNGQGLFKWDGEKVRRRYLLRDTTIFDKVNALDYDRGYVYVGADEALYVFNGGKWTTYTIEDGLPSNKINSIDAGDWMVYIGTDKGVTSFFNGDFYRAGKFENAVASAFGRVDGKMIVATDNSIMFKPDRNQIVTLIESDIEVEDALEFVEEGNDSIPDMADLEPMTDDVVDPNFETALEADQLPEVVELDNVDQPIGEMIDDILNADDEAGITEVADEPVIAGNDDQIELSPIMIDDPSEVPADE